MWLNKAVEEYVVMIQNVSVDYTDQTTVKKLRNEHPELNFMEDEEIEEILYRAKLVRNSLCITA